MKGLICIVIALSTVCAFSRPSGATGNSDATLGKAEVLFNFFSGSEAKDYLEPMVTKLPAEEENMERELIGACNPDSEEAISPRIFGGAADLILKVGGWIFEKTIGFLTSEIDKALKSELKKYADNFAASKNLNFYKKIPIDGEGPELKNICFRLTRKVTKSSGEEMVAMDFVGKFEVLDREVMKVIPLRLFYSQSKAKTDESNQIGVAISLNLDVVWRENNEGKEKANVFDKVILSQKVKLSSEDTSYFYKNYYHQPDPEKSRESDQRALISPLIPWSRYDNISYGSNLTSAKVSVSEVGVAPWLLEKGEAWFSKNKEKIDSELTEAAKTALEKTLPEN